MSNTKESITDKILEQMKRYVRNIFVYRTFSLNLNSRGYWNDKLGQMGLKWRDKDYYAILEYLPKAVSFTLLDVGCALGDGCELIKSRRPAAKITGVDLSDVGIRRARSKSREIEYQILDILSDPLPAYYDYITIVETLEHFDDPFAIVDKCLSKTKEALLISTPYTPRRSGRFWAISEHRYFFNERTFSQYSCTFSFPDSDHIVYKIVPRDP